MGVRAEERQPLGPHLDSAAHAARCTAPHGVFATPNPAGANIGLHQVRPPLALADVAEREPEPLPLDAHDDQAEAGPGAAEGWGVKRIAATLNNEGARAPMPRRTGRPRGWAPSSVREVLHRDLYRGVVVWNRTARVVLQGARAQRERPASDAVTVSVPELAIVDGPVGLAFDTDGSLWATAGALSHGPWLYMENQPRRFGPALDRSAQRGLHERLYSPPEWPHAAGVRKPDGANPGYRPARTRSLVRV